MSHANNIITAPVDVRGDIAYILGRRSGDVGHLCGDTTDPMDGVTPDPGGKINPMAVYKPIKHTTIGILTDSARAVAKYGIAIPHTDNPANLIRTTYTWKYNKPTGSSYPYRVLDFVSSDSPTVLGYYPDAPKNILCCLKSSSDTININPVNEYAPVVGPRFYAFSKKPDNNGIFDKQPDTSQGISGTSYNHTSNQLACSLGIEDISADNGTLFTGENRMLGLALFTGTTPATYQEFVPCISNLSNNNATLNRNMVTIADATMLSIPVGDYNAVGCLRVGNPIVNIGEEPVFSYLPLHAYNWDGSDNKKNQFKLHIGGVNDYSVRIVGIADTEGGTPSGVCTDSNGVVYLFVDITNNSSIQHHTGVFSFDRWANYVLVDGSYVDSQGETQPVHDTLIESIKKVNGTTVSSTKVFDIAPGATVRMMFEVGPLWGSTLETIRSGRVYLTPQLKFDQANFSQEGMLLAVDYAG